MSNEQQDPKNLDEAWNDFMEARTRLLQRCSNNFSQQASIMKQLPKSDRRQLLLEAKSTGFSDRIVAQTFDVSVSTVRRATVDDGKQMGEDR